MAIQGNDLLTIYRPTDSSNRKIRIDGLPYATTSYWKMDGNALSPIANNSLIDVGNGSITLESNGTATFLNGNFTINVAGQTKAYRVDNDDNPVCIYRAAGDTADGISMYGSGDATFAGAITAASMDCGTY